MIMFEEYFSVIVIFFYYDIDIVRTEPPKIVINLFHTIHPSFLFLPRC